MDYTENRIRLRAITRAFGLSATAISKATKVSRPYVARLLSVEDRFQGSSEFWARLERSLGEIIGSRSGQYFYVEPIRKDGLDGLL